MRFDLIQKVTFHKLPGKDYDRRGRLATFWLREIPNTEYMYDSSALVVRNIIDMLHDHYEMNWFDPQNLKSYLFGEAQDCWVNRDYQSPPKIGVEHKYWGQEQIDAFYEIIKTLAKLHKWEIEDNR